MPRRKPDPEDEDETQTPAVDETRRRAEEESIQAAVRAAKFRSFEDFLAARSDRRLVDMADELGVPRAVFLSYHARWVDQRAPLIPQVGGDLSDLTEETTR